LPHINCADQKLINRLKIPPIQTISIPLGLKNSCHFHREPGVLLLPTPEFFLPTDVGEDNIIKAGIFQGKVIIVEGGKVVAIPGRTSANQKHCARGRSRGFLPCPEMQCACSLGLSLNSPLTGGTGQGFLSSPAVKYRDSEGQVCQNFCTLVDKHSRGS
jgi:hypothetical protein